TRPPGGSPTPPSEDASHLGTHRNSNRERRCRVVARRTGGEKKQTGRSRRDAPCNDHHGRSGRPIVRSIGIVNRVGGAPRRGSGPSTARIVVGAAGHEAERSTGAERDDPRGANGGRSDALRGPK